MVHPILRSKRNSRMEYIQERPRCSRCTAKELIPGRQEYVRVVYIQANGRTIRCRANAFLMNPMAVSMRVVLSITRRKETVNKFGVKVHTREIATKVGS